MASNERVTMPTYEYKCPLCQGKYTEVRGMNDSQTITDCENCKVPLIKQFGSPTITFSGSGFYSTDKKAN